MFFSTRTILVLVFAPTLIALLIANPKSLAQDCTLTADYCWNCSTIGDYAANGAYKANLNTVLLTDIASQSSGDVYFFRNASSGRNPDEVYAIGLCRADVEFSTCRACLNETSHRLLEQYCPGKKEAILWGEFCMVRYSNRSMFSLKVDEPLKVVPNPADAKDGEQFKAVLMPFLGELINQAASSTGRFAYAGTTVLNANLPVHALVQCTPDLSQRDCTACLNDSTLKIPQGKIGGRVLKPSCSLRFESGDPFYRSSNTSSNPNVSCSLTSDFCWSCYGLGEDTNSNSVYMRNLRSLLSSLNGAENPYGFYNMSSGEKPDQVSVIAMCRGDMSPKTCHECINNSSQRLISGGAEYCPNRKKAIAWQERCMVRYSNESIFSLRQDDPSKHASNPNQATQLEAFRLALDPLLRNLSAEAASGDSMMKYASGTTPVQGYEGLYAIAQCTPDLDKRQCSGCLQDAMSSVQDCCQGAQGVKMLKPSCVLRYEVNEFFGTTIDPTVLLHPPPPDSDPQGKEKNEGTKKRNIIIIGVGTSVGTMAILIGIFAFIKSRRINVHHKLPTQYEEIAGSESLQYDLATIRAATEDFSEENKLGRGGFGDVFRGTLSNGQFIAVKRLSKSSNQGDREFKNEVTLVAKLQHRNLVRLLGFCLDDKETLLVYEFVPNSSLDKYIFNPTKRADFDWDTRHKIIIGIARGLLYIHEDSRLKIVHCDLKGGNILLDEEMNPKISDFGMARLFALDETQGETKKAAGTYGYMAPEYAIQGHFSVKSDVFSFGVLLLEIISGQKNSFFRGEGEDQGHLLTYAWKYWKNGTALNLVDPIMTVGPGAEEIMKCIHIGLLCVQENVADRPTMNLVVHMLNSRSQDTLSVPTQPGYFMGTIATRQQNHSSTNSTQASVDEAPITQLSPRD